MPFSAISKPKGSPSIGSTPNAVRAGENGKTADPSGYAKEIRALHLDDPRPNAEILEHVDRIERSYPLYDIPNLPCWLLIGDATHAVGPHAGQGAAMAIEDALVLAASLEAEHSCAAAFRRFEKLRRERIDRVVELTARNSSQKRTSGLGLIPRSIKMGREVFRYRVDIAPLEQP
jgi:2-polyprenyl-6-methoxyphenol hydroxylase-like FAD-dependent oxidoreductase